VSLGVYRTQVTSCVVQRSDIHERYTGGLKVMEFIAANTF
jgi:hypothetical protein